MRDFLTASKQTTPPAGNRLPSLEELTASGSIMGSPQYMSPEQAQGNLHDIGRHTDVYGLGAILYELLTGRPPFQAANLADLLNQVRNVLPSPPRQFEPAIPPSLEAVCLKCLEKEVRRRFPTAAAQAESLQQCLDGWKPAAELQAPVTGYANRLDDQLSSPPTRAESDGMPLDEPSNRSWWRFRRKSN